MDSGVSPALCCWRGQGGAVHLKGFLINPGREDPKGLLEAPRNPSFLNAAIVYLVLTRQQTPL